MKKSNIYEKYKKFYHNHTIKLGEDGNETQILTEHKKYTSYPTFTIPLSFTPKGKPKKTAKLHPEKMFSDAFIPALSDKTAVQIYFGGAGTGKSVSIARRTILDMLGGKRNFLVVRQVHASLRDSFFAEMSKAARDLGVYSKFQFIESRLEVKCKTTGTKALFRGLDKIEKIMSITVSKGIITDLIIEEATDITEPNYDKLISRLRGLSDTPKRITLLLNPVHTGHWIYTRFFAGQFPDNAKVVRYAKEVPYTNEHGEIEIGVEKVVIHKTNYKDNKFISPEDRIRLEGYKGVNDYLYEVLALGNWGVLGDLIFPEFEIRDLTGVEGRFKHIYDGMDFDFNPNPFAYVALAKTREHIYILAERGEVKSLSAEIARLVKPILGTRDLIADCNESRTIAELQAKGLNIHPVAKWKGNNEDAISYFRQFKIVIDYRCTRYIREIQGYAYQKDKNGHTINKPCDGNDHFIQASYYALNNQIKAYEPTKIGR
jgi:phage terminase large subunit